MGYKNHSTAAVNLAIQLLEACVGS